MFVGGFVINKERTLKSTKRRTPIGKCPNCGSTIVYSDKGTDKKYISVICAGDDYKGTTYLCAKCKTMVAIIDNR